MFFHRFLFSLPITLSLINAKYTIPPRIFVKITNRANSTRSDVPIFIDNIISRSTNSTQIIDISRDILTSTTANGILNRTVPIANT